MRAIQILCSFDCNLHTFCPFVAKFGHQIVPFAAQYLKYFSSINPFVSRAYTVPKFHSEGISIPPLVDF